MVEGGYVPFAWRQDFDEQYLPYIRFICLAMADAYIDAHFNEIREHSSDIERRLDDTAITIDGLKADNRTSIAGFGRCQEKVTFIDSDYEWAIKSIISSGLAACED